MTILGTFLWSYTDNADTDLDIHTGPNRGTTLRIRAHGQFFDATITIPASQIPDLATALTNNTDWAYDSIINRIAILTPSSSSGGTLLELAEDELDVDAPPRILIPDGSRQAMAAALSRAVSSVTS